LKWKFFPKKVILKFGPRNFFRPTKLGAKSRLIVIWNQTEELSWLPLCVALLTCIVYFRFRMESAFMSSTSRAPWFRSSRGNLRIRI